MNEAHKINRKVNRLKRIRKKMLEHLAKTQQIQIDARNDGERDLTKAETKKVAALEERYHNLLNRGLTLVDEL